MRVIELRCENGKHGELVIADGVTMAPVKLEVKCHWCTKQKKRPVFHVWNVANGARLEDKGENFAQAA